MKKYLKEFILWGTIFIFSFIVVGADAKTVTYIGCGNQTGIPYDIPGVVRETINFIRIFVPIILILLGSIDLFKVVFSGEKDDLSKAVGKLVKRCIAAAAVFFVIIFVQLLLSLLGKDSEGMMACISCFVSDESQCYTYDVQKADNNEEAEEAARKREELAEKREEIRKENEEEANNIREQNGSSSGGSNNNNNNNNSNNYNCTKSGTYNGTRFCAPNARYRFYSSSSTPGCGSSAVQHDSSFPSETPVYAAIDGTVYFYQTHCNGVLYSYGNQAKLVGSDGTYIIYAHLKSFPSGITPTYTRTCNYPCSASSCSGGVSRKDLGSMTVRAGDLIGYSGTTGNSSGPHLHVEIHYRGGSCISDLNAAFGL